MFRIMSRNEFSLVIPVIQILKWSKVGRLAVPAKQNRLLVLMVLMGIDRIDVQKLQIPNNRNNRKIDNVMIRQIGFVK